MKKLLLMLFVALLPGLAAAQVGSPVPSTAYTRTFLRSPNQSNAWYNLGIVGTNQTQVTNWVTAIPSGVLIVDPTISVTATSPAAAYFPIGVPDATGGLMGTPDYLNVSRFNITNLTADTAAIPAMTGDVAFSGALTMSNLTMSGTLTATSNSIAPTMQWFAETNLLVAGLPDTDANGVYTYTSDWYDDTLTDYITNYAGPVYGMLVAPGMVLSGYGNVAITNGAGTELYGYNAMTPGDGGTWLFLPDATNYPGSSFTWVSNLVNVGWTIAGPVTFSQPVVGAGSPTQAFIQIFPDGHRIGIDGKEVWPTNSLTRGIQEALDAAHGIAWTGGSSSGGRLVFAPGIYETANTINAYTGNGELNGQRSMIFDGPGMTACAIVYTNNANPSNVIYTAGAGEFVMRNMTVASTQNTNTAIIHGVMCNGDLQNVMIGRWSSVSGAGAYYGFSAAASPFINHTNDLVGITNWGTGPWMLRNCTFVELAVGVFIGNDHTEIEHCSFFGCGAFSYTNTFNHWPINHPARLGGGVVINAIADFSHGGGNNVHNFFANKFYWSAPCYLMAHSGLRALASYGDSSELATAGRPLLATVGQRFATINPMHQLADYYRVAKVTSGDDWTAFTDAPVGTFPVIDFANQRSTNWMAVCDGLILTTNTPASDASGQPFRVVTAGQGKFWNSNSALYWITTTKTNLIVDGQ